MVSGHLPPEKMSYKDRKVAVTEDEFGNPVTTTSNDKKKKAKYAGGLGTCYLCYYYYY